MDTDELTEEAYRVLIGRSGEISEFLQVEIGATARHHKDEDSYLDAIYKGISYFADHPQEFLSKWGLLEEIEPHHFGVQLTRLAEEIFVVRNTPIEDRGPTAD
jgi:hypothetical protein